MLKYTSILFCLLVCYSHSVFSQNMTRVKQNIQNLAAANMFGRGYVFEGEKKAALYIAQEFKNANIKAYPQKIKSSLVIKNKQEKKLATYFQPFSLPINTFPETPYLRIEFIDNDTTKNNTAPTYNITNLEAGKDFIIAPNSFGKTGNGKIYIVDTLLFSQNETAITNFLATNLTNKIVTYHSRFEKELYNLPTSLLRHWFSAQAFIKISPKLTMSLANAATMQPTFEVLDTKWELLTKQNTITEANFSITNKVIENYETQNVIGYLKGTSKTDSMIVFSAHYDHLGSLGKEVVFYGANDNASGISMLIELANYYSKNPPPCDIIFMAFGAEEAGLLGSKFFTENPLVDLSKIKLFINLDLVGTGDDGLGIVNATVFPKQYSNFENTNQQLGYFSKVIKRGKAANSDHYFFSEKGVPAFFIYTLGGTQAYHDIDDKAESLPLTKYDKLFELLVQWVGLETKSKTK
jgi:aminopeptidase YwaD